MLTPSRTLINQLRVGYFLPKFQTKYLNTFDRQGVCSVEQFDSGLPNYNSNFPFVPAVSIVGYVGGLVSHYRDPHRTQNAAVIKSGNNKCFYTKNYVNGTCDTFCGFLSADSPILGGLFCANNSICPESVYQFSSPYQKGHKPVRICF